VGLPFDDLQPPSIDEVRKLITSMPGKSSPVDHIPTSVIKSCVDVFAPLIAHLAKLSFSEGKFPMRYKTASITPLLKKKETNPEVASNYRPISNLYTISKMLEKLFMSRIRPHVETSADFNRFQSAYRHTHSTETTLLRMLNDVYDTADNQPRSLVLKLDLYAAFDTLDKTTLLHRLDHTFGVLQLTSGSSPTWMGEVSLLGWAIALLHRFFVNTASHKAVCWEFGTLVIYHLHLTDLQCHCSVQEC